MAAPSETRCSSAGTNLPHREPIRALQPPAQRVDEHLAHEVVQETIVGTQQLDELERAGEAAAAGELARGIDRSVLIDLAHGTDPVEHLEAEAERVHAGVAYRALRV